MIRHTLVFRLRRPVAEEERSRFLDAVRAFGARPPFAQGPATVREDLGLRPEGRSVSEGMFFVDFAGTEEFARYLADPAHIAFVTDVLTPGLESWLSTQTELADS